MSYKISIDSFNGPGSYMFGIEGRELLIGTFNEIKPEDNLIKSCAKAAINAGIRISAAPFPFLPKPFSYIGLPYCSYYGVGANLFLAGLKGYQACDEKDWNKGKEALKHVAFAALDYYGLSFLNDRNLTGYITCGIASLYTAAGVAGDLMKVSKKVHGWMFPAPAGPQIPYGPYEVPVYQQVQVPVPGPVQFVNVPGPVVHDSPVPRKSIRRNEVLERLEDASKYGPNPRANIPDDRPFRRSSRLSVVKR